MSVSFEARFTRALVRSLGRLTYSIDVTAVTSIRTRVWGKPHSQDHQETRKRPDK